MSFRDKRNELQKKIEGRVEHFTWIDVTPTPYPAPYDIGNKKWYDLWMELVDKEN